MSMYSSSIPVLLQFLNNLSNILKKGEDFAKEKDIKGTVLTSARLAPDMFPMKSQVQIACDVAKGCGARLSGTEAPSYEDNERTFEELQARIQKTIAFLESFSADQIDGTENKAISLKAGPNVLNYTGEEYLSKFVMPNVFFHITTAYNILRHNGVELGKMDFLAE